MPLCEEMLINLLHDFIFLLNLIKYLEMLLFGEALSQVQDISYIFKCKYKSDIHRVGLLAVSGLRFDHTFVLINVQCRSPGLQSKYTKTSSIGEH